MISEQNAGGEQYVVSSRTYSVIRYHLPVLQRRLGHTVQHLLREKEITLCHITTPFLL